MMKSRDTWYPGIIKDLLKNKIIMFQHKYYVWLLILTNGLPILFFGWLLNDYIGAFLFTFLLRLFITHHFTWFINSWAHTKGKQPYSKEHTAVDNWLLAFFTWGEGYHNFHHTFPNDYRNGVRWWQWDPTKVLIWCFSMIGLGNDLKRTSKFVIQRKMLMEDKRIFLPKAGKMYDRMYELAEEINAKISDAHKLWAEYKELKKAKQKERIAHARNRLRFLKKSIRIDLRSWARLCRQVAA